jgi:hypothetical protein
MALSTYSDLQTSIANWLVRSDLNAYIPDLITLGEGFLRSEKRLLVREAETQVPLTGTDGVFTLPEDFAAFREVKHGTYGSLSFITPDQASDRYPTNEGGVAQFFTIIGSSLTTYPATADSLTLTYYKKVPALSDANPTNWCLTAFPHVYLYASLIQAEAFIKNDPRIGVWTTMLEEALSRIKGADDFGRYSRVSARVKGPTP